MNLLEVNKICKTYGSGETAVKALKDVSFSIPKGEYWLYLSGVQPCAGADRGAEYHLPSAAGLPEAG